MNIGEYSASSSRISSNIFCILQQPGDIIFCIFRGSRIRSLLTYFCYGYCCLAILSEDVRLLISFEKAFINQFFRIILSPCYWEFSPNKSGKNFFTLGPIFVPKKTQSENHCKYLGFICNKDYYYY
jgi:hypothetical protein